MAEIAKDDKIYFAGLFDGEGCVFIHKTHSASGKNNNYTLAVSFGLTYEPVLKKMQKLFGGSVCRKDMDKCKKSP